MDHVLEVDGRDLHNPEHDAEIGQATAASENASDVA